MKKNVFVYTGKKNNSQDTYDIVIKELKDRKHTICSDPADADLIICIGGDGTFLRLVQNHNFPASPILGINTGHLGFFQEVEPSEIIDFFDQLESDNYQIQKIYPVEAEIHTDGKIDKIKGLNEILVRGPYTHITHLDVYVENTLIQRFCGDGLLFSTPVGSTAYNYSLGGAIVSPDLSALQMTPIAPSNTNAYRSFPSSIMYSDDKKATLIPADRSKEENIYFSYDGLSSVYDKVGKIVLVKSNDPIKIIRFSSYDYWQKLTSKLL